VFANGFEHGIGYRRLIDLGLGARSDPHENALKMLS
jgi:hypothetical protein